MSLQYGRDHDIPPELLLRAYASGMFPMAEDANDPEIFWVKPESRGIIPLDCFHVPRRLARTVRKTKLTIRINSDFYGTLEGCAEQTGSRSSTWINEPIRRAYDRLFEMGHCHSVEAWDNQMLVGGLYGVTLGGAFFGESMFSRQADASKICLVHLVDRLKARGFVLLDTQFTTAHLSQFGAIEVPRLRYESLLTEALQEAAIFWP